MTERLLPPGGKTDGIPEVRLTHDTVCFTVGQEAELTAVLVTPRFPT